MKVDCDALALEVTGVRKGRVSSYAKEPQELYEREYEKKATPAADVKAAAKTRHRRKAFTPSPERSHGKHREQATSFPAVDSASPEPLEPYPADPAVDPHGDSNTGKPTTRVAESSSSDLLASSPEERETKTEKERPE